MDIRELAKEVIIDKGGIAKSADFVAAGMRAVDVVNMCNAGYLDRVRHGYYQLAGQDTSSEEQLLATLIPQGSYVLNPLFSITDIVTLHLASGQ